MIEVLQTIVKHLVEEKDKVKIEENKKGRYHNFKVFVASKDMGNVIGKGGSVAESIRTIISSMTKDKISIKFEALEIE